MSVATMIEHRLHAQLKAAPNRRDLSVPLRETGCKAIVFSLACLLAWGVPTFRARSQGATPVTLSASEVERSFIEQAPLYRQRALTYPAEFLAKSYFSEALTIKTLPRAKAGVNVITLKDGTPQRVTKENVDAYIKGYSGILAIIDQSIRQRGFRQVGGTFVMNVGPSCVGFNNGAVSIAQSDFRIKLVSGWPAVFEKLAQLNGLANLEGIVIEDTIAVGLPGRMEEVVGLGKVEAGRTEINFGHCKVTLTRQIGPSAAAPSNAAHDNLNDASDAGDLSRVKALLAANADVNATDPDGTTALFLAAQNGHVEVVQALLAAKADVNAKTANGATALFIASAYGHLEVVRALLAANADVTVKRAGDGGTALFIAAQEDRLEVVKALIAANADVNAKGIYGATPLIQAAGLGHLEVVRALLAANADANAKPANGFTALMSASMSGHAAMVQALLAAKADVNAKAGNGFTALIQASQQGHLEVVQALLAAGADVNAKRDDGFTALMIAVQKGHLDVVKALLGAKVYVNAKTANGETAMDLATKGGFAEIAELLKASLPRPDK
jgi:ankyrin repeat protein